MQQHSLTSLEAPPPIAAPACSPPSVQSTGLASNGHFLSPNLSSVGADGQPSAPPAPADSDAFGGAPSSSNGMTVPAPTCWGAESPLDMVQSMWSWAPLPSFVPFDGKTASSLIPSLRVAAFSSSAGGRKRKHQVDTVPPARHSDGNFELMLSPSEFSSNSAAMVGSVASGRHAASGSLVPVPGSNLNRPSCVLPGLTQNAPMRPRGAKVKSAVKPAVKTSKAAKASTRKSPAGATLAAPHGASSSVVITTNRERPPRAQLPTHGSAGPCTLAGGGRSTGCVSPRRAPRAPFAARFSPAATAAQKTPRPHCPAGLLRFSRFARRRGRGDPRGRELGRASRCCASPLRRAVAAPSRLAYGAAGSPTRARARCARRRSCGGKVADLRRQVVGVVARERAREHRAAGAAARPHVRRGRAGDVVEHLGAMYCGVPAASSPGASAASPAVGDLELGRVTVPSRWWCR